MPAANPVTLLDRGGENRPLEGNMWGWPPCLSAGMPCTFVICLHLAWTSYLLDDESPELTFYFLQVPPHSPTYGIKTKPNTNLFTFLVAPELALTQSLASLPPSYGECNLWCLLESRRWHTWVKGIWWKKQCGVGRAHLSRDTVHPKGA